MLDFLTVVAEEKFKKDTLEIRIYPKFIVRTSKDLMIRGGTFYAIWYEEAGLWSTDEEVALNLIDAEIKEFVKEIQSKNQIAKIIPLYLWDSDTGMVDKWHKYCEKQSWDNYHQLDTKLIFSNTKTKKEDYASKKLPYPLESGEPKAWNELVSVLYSEEEKKKIEWAIGSIVSGASVDIQKFIVMYGSAGTGKSTVLNIIQDLFEGYYSVFDAKALGSANNVFALEAFKSNPLVAIQHDGDLSKIEDNTRLNSLVSHEYMTVNEKFKSTYTNRFISFLFMGTNRPVKITDAKSGILRRLIDVTPTGKKIAFGRYKELMGLIKFELGQIATRCKEVYLNDPYAYDDYIPVSMMGASNDFYNFVLDSFELFKSQDGTTLKAAWEMYKQYCDEAKVPFPYSQRNFKEELKNYFQKFEERGVDDNEVRVWNYYSGFITDKFDYKFAVEIDSKVLPWLEFKEQSSLLDDILKDCPAQYANDKETPAKKWDQVTTTLKELDTSKLHYTKMDDVSHIVVDFDKKNEKGEKDFDLNFNAALSWPPTYAELSKGGHGIHLHYIYTGDANMLSRIFDEDIEIKVFAGNSSLRRRLSKCNDLPIARISSGLPLKGEKPMVSFEGIKTEKGLRAAIVKNLQKKIHPYTKPSVDFIYKILEDAYAKGLKYDVSDMQSSIFAFAASSSNQSEYCIKLVNKMKFKSEEENNPDSEYKDDILVFYDVEVFPNLFLINWKKQGEDCSIVRMINPTPSEVEELIKFKLVGFNCRRYDNHILYARLLGSTNEELYRISRRIINGEPNSLYSAAYNISYTDIYDFSSKKQSLKKWEIELGIHHEELGLPWDQPVPEELWWKVAKYCDNDVIAEEAVFNARQGDWKVRQILVDLCNSMGVSACVNDTSNTLTTKLIFGNEKHPKLVYTDLATGKQY